MGGWVGDCWLVGWSVGRLVARSIGWLVGYLIGSLFVCVITMHSRTCFRLAQVIRGVGSASLVVHLNILRIHSIHAEVEVWVKVCEKVCLRDRDRFKVMVRQRVRIRVRAGDRSRVRQGHGQAQAQFREPEVAVGFIVATGFTVLGVPQPPRAAVRRLPRALQGGLRRGLVLG